MLFVELSRSEKLFELMNVCLTLFWVVSIAVGVSDAVKAMAANDRGRKGMSVLMKTDTI